MHTNMAARIACAVLLGMLPAFWLLVPAPAAGQIAGAEYFFDVDPGPGNGTPLPAKDGGFDQDVEEVEVDLTGVTGSVGRHTLYVRFRDASGAWGIARPVLGDNLFTAPYNFRLTGNKWIAGAECFFDNDPGEGNGTPLAAADGAFDEAQEDIDFAGVDPSALSGGVHHLFVRLQDSEGAWGPARRVAFQGRPLGGCEYYLDTDPGEGAGTPLASTDGAFDTGQEFIELAAIDTTGLTEGWHTLSVRCLDGRGYWGNPEPHDFYMDYTNPVVDITAPAGCTPDSTPDLVCTVTDERPMTVVVTVDGTVVGTPCGGTLDVLPEGNHTVVVTSTDAAGNQGTASSRFAIGATAPTVSLTAPQGFTDDPTPVLAYAVDDPSAVVVVTVDGIVVAKTSGDSLDPLPDASHEVVVTATNSCGSSGSAAGSFTIDTAAPIVAIAAPAEGSITSDPTPLLSFSVDESNPGTTVVQVDGAVVSKLSGDSLDALGDGPHTVSVTHTDLAGNSGSANAAFSVNTAAPTVSITAPGNNSYTNQATPVLTFVVDDPAATVVVAVDGVAVAKASGDMLDALAEGTHTVSVQATSGAGDVGSDSASFTVDLTAPTVSISSPADGLLTNDPTPLLVFSVDDANPGSSAVQVDGTAVGTTSGAPLDSLEDGTHTVLVEATDLAGTAGSGSATFTVDTLPPSVSIESPKHGWRYRETSVVLSYTATEGSPETSLDGTTVAAPSGATLGPLTLAEHTVRVQTIDAAGNQGFATCTFEVTETHRCDGDANSKVSLSELMRIIQLYNGAAYHCDPAGEDGYGPGTGDQSCQPHDADYQAPRWAIGLSELLRLIQLYNSDGYHLDPAGEDGFAVGL